MIWNHGWAFRLVMVGGVAFAACGGNGGTADDAAETTEDVPADVPDDVAAEADAGDVGDTGPDEVVDADGDIAAEVDVEADGDAPPTCPDMLARARVRDGGAEWSSGLTVALMDTVEFDADPAWVAELMEAVTYQWSIVEHPDGFLGRFLPSSATRAPAMDLTIMGHYVLQLETTDSAGGAVCPPSQVQVDATAVDRLVVELVWTTPGDEDERDIGFLAGTDVDLHMIPAGGTWNDRLGGDCHFRTPHPDWGDPADSDDDPDLDRDDTDGGGPETITVRSPALTSGSGATYYDGPYQVGVYFYDDYEFGDVYLRLRIYLEGDPTPVAVWPSDPDDGGTHADGRRFLGRRLVRSDASASSSGDFWSAGEIDWTESGGVLREVDTVSTGFP